MLKNSLRLLRALVLKDRPVYVHYGITHRCNLACGMCHIKQDGGVDQELAADGIRRLFDALRALGVAYVSIGGGEPLLRDDLPEILGDLRRKGFRVRLLTNGFLATEDLIKRFAEAGLREVSISLDTLDPRKQDEICGMEGAFQKIIGAMSLFSRILPREKRRLLINVVVSPLNVRELSEVSRFAKRLGYGISFVPIESDQSSKFAFNRKDHVVLDQSYEALLKLKKERGSNIFNSSWFLEKSRDYLKNGKRNWRCDAGKLYLSVNPQGEVALCHKFGSLAPVFEKDFMGSKEYEKIRLDLTAHCSGCMRPCWAEISSLFHDKKSFCEMIRMEWRGWGQREGDQ